MKNYKKGLLALAAAVCAAALTGCGQLRSETGPVSATNKVTEAPVIRVTERVTEAPETEAPQTETQAPQTETQAPQTETQAPQTETQAQAPAVLSKEEEVAQETEYDQSKTMWAMDDINVRDTPTTDEDNISYSLDQGQTATVTGETPNWYEVSIPYTDEDGNPQEYVGFVSKQFMSNTEVQPKTDEERAQAADAAAAQTVAPADTSSSSDTASSSSQTSGGAATSSGTTVTMAADANIRADASQTSDVVGVVNAGTQVTVIGDTDGWYQVDYNGVQGYVNKNLVG